MTGFAKLFEKLANALDAQAAASEMVFSNLPTLETPHLVLRKMTMHDAKDIFAYAQDEQVARYVLWEPHRTLGDSKAYLRCMLRQYKEAMPSSYAIVLKETGCMIGTVGFMNYSPDDRCAEVGYSLGRAYWNKGYATEALRAVIALSFDRMMLHRIECVHDVRNAASGKVMQKCGLLYEGRIRKKILNKNEYVDVDQYAILDSDPR